MYERVLFTLGLSLSAVIDLLILDEVVTPRSTRDRNITRSLQVLISAKFSISVFAIFQTTNTRLLLLYLLLVRYTIPGTW